MGLSLGDLYVLRRLKTSGHIPNRCSIIEIGAQQIDDRLLASRDDLDAFGRLFDIAEPCPLFSRIAPLSGRTDRLADAPMARDFWRWLGFDYASIDIDGSPGSIPLDLNYDPIPPSAKGKFQLVTNLGTTEHIANQLHAFKVIHDLTAVEGVMVHNVPSLGMLNHGLVSYSPKFFWMLGRSNGYKCLHMDMAGAPAALPMPADLVEFISAFAPDFPARATRFAAPAGALLVVLQKRFETEFVAPLDVESGTRTDNEALQKRYWTVFTPNAWAPMLASRECIIEDQVRERSEALYAREQIAAAGELDLEERKRAVYEREQAVAARENPRPGLPRLYARLRSRIPRIRPLARPRARPLRQAPARLRRWAYSRSPQWLIAMKRKLFGVSVPR